MVCMAYYPTISFVCVVCPVSHITEPRNGNFAETGNSLLFFSPSTCSVHSLDIDLCGPSSDVDRF